MGMFSRIFGLVLLAAVWLPTALLGRSHGNSPQHFPKDGPNQSETAYTLGAVPKSVPFHQFRLSTGPLPLTKGLSWGNGDACPPTSSSSPGTGWIQTPVLGTAPHGSIQTWQFSQRTALSPRAPCPR